MIEQIQNSSIDTLGEFAVVPNLGDTPHSAEAFLYGAVLGFFAYSTYDLTNLAVMKEWTLKLAIVDMLWGTVLTGAVAGLTTMITGSIFL